MPETMSPDLMLAATRGPAPTTSIGDLIRQQQQAHLQQLAAQQQLQAGAMELRKQQQAYNDEQRYRQIVMANAAPSTLGAAAQGQPPPLGVNPTTGRPSVRIDDGATPGATPEQAPQQQAPPPQQMPQPGDVAPASYDYTGAIRQLRAAGLHQQADALYATMLKQDQEKATAEKDRAQAFNDTATGQEKHNTLLYQATSYLMSQPDEQSMAAAWPQVLGHLNQQGAKLDPNMPFPGAQWLANEHGVAQTQVQKDQQAKELRDQQLFQPQLDKAKADARIAVANAGVDENKLKLIQNANPQEYKDVIDQIAPPGVKGNAALNSRMTAQVNFALKRGDIAGAQAAMTAGAAEMGALEKATDPRVQANKVSLTIANTQARADANLSASGMTPDDFARAGEQYARTGVMPPMGRDSATRGRISHMANEWARNEGLSPAEVVQMQAAYAGDKESLKKFQTQRDQIVSFESAAKKNIDLFLDQAKQLPDSGIPWLNTPLRLLDEKLVGRDFMPAIRAAQRVMNNEVAKVTGGGGLGGVLSDSARHDIDELNGKDITFPAAVKLANVMKQDMANRHGSMDSTLSDIKSRIGGGGASGGGSTATKRFNLKTGQIEDIPQ